MNPRTRGREIGSPKAWGRARPGMSWHHIIPYSLLREVWNRLADWHVNTEVGHPRAIRQYLLLSVDRKVPELEALIDRMRAANTDQKRAGHNPLQPLDVAEDHQLDTVALWPPWNAVEGPQRRSDDPQDRYFDRFTSGLTADEATRMRAIESLFKAFQAFVSAGPVPGPASLRALGDAAWAARPLVRCDLPIRYRPEMWVEDPNGLWRKRRDGERYAAAGQ
jgi:hypothetical protein